MPKRERTPIDRLVAPAVANVVRSAEQKARFISVNQTSDGNSFADFYFLKDDVIKEVLNRDKVEAMLSDLQRRYGEWRIDTLIVRYVSFRVSRYLAETRNRWGVREYENYSDGTIARRWMPTRFVTADRLRQILQQARVLERDIHIKGEGYFIALRRLEELERQGKRVRFGDIMEEVGPIIQQYRLTGKDPTPQVAVS